MQNSRLEQDIRSSIDAQLKNLGWVFDGANRNVFQEQPREDNQKKKLKGKRPDYVLYSSKEKYRKEPLMIIETKKPGANLNDALGQGNWYAEQLQAPLVFATDGIYYKTFHSKFHKPLYLNGEEVNELIRELEAIKFLENNEVDTISKEVRYGREQLINIFEEANNLLRNEGLKAGMDRFSEFSNILFLKLLGEIEDLKEERGERFLVNKDFRWSCWKNKKGDGLLSFVNDTVLREMGKIYQDVDIFTPLEIKNPTILERIIDKLEPLNLINIDSDIKGDAFEYFLQKSTATKNDLGEYFTPRHIVKAMVKLINPQIGEKIYDPFCGTGGMLTESFKHISNNMARTKDNWDMLRNRSIFGNEITNTARITKMNMILIGDGHSGIQQKDSLRNPIEIEDQYDAVITNMPYSQKTEYGSFYDLPGSSGDSICIQHCIKAINKDSNNGRMAIIVPEGFLFRRDMQKAREYLLNRCYLKSIISLPQGVFLPYTAVKTNILYCTDVKKKRKQEKFWYFDVKNDGYTLDNHRRKIEGENDLQKLLAYRNTDIQEKRDILSVGFSEINMKEVQANDLVLSGNRYKKVLYYSGTELELVDIEDVARTIRGVIYSKHDESLVPTNRAILRANNIDSETNNLDLSEIRYLKNDLQIEEEKKLKENDILICTSSGSKSHLGKFALINREKDFFAGGFMSIIRPDVKKIIPQYLYFVLSAIPYREYIERITSGSNINNLKNKDIESFKIPLPPIEKQQEIIDELMGYQKIINGARQIVDSYKPKINIDNNWKLIELGSNNLFEIQSGGTPNSRNKDFWDGDINWITLVDLPADNFITEIFESKRKITKKGLNSSSAKLLPKNTVVVSSRATIGRVGIARKELATNQGFKNIIIKTPKLINEKYIAYIMTTLTEQMNLMALGGTFKEISKTNFKKLVIPLPSKKVQDEIVKRIDAEQALIEPNKKIIKLFENKTHERLNLIWGR